MGTAREIGILSFSGTTKPTPIDEPSTSSATSSESGGTEIGLKREK
jgi:hypothetical protein